MAAGRKRLYKPETLEIGEKLELSGPAAIYPDQYAKNFRKSNEGKYFKKKVENGKVFIERVL